VSTHKKTNIFNFFSFIVRTITNIRTYVLLLSLRKG